MWSSPKWHARPIHNLEVQQILTKFKFKAEFAPVCHRLVRIVALNLFRGSQRRGAAQIQGWAASVRPSIHLSTRPSVCANLGNQDLGTSLRLAWEVSGEQLEVKLATRQHGDEPHPDRVCTLGLDCPLRPSQRTPRNCQHVYVTVFCGMCCNRVLLCHFAFVCCVVLCFMWCVCCLVSSCTVLCAVHAALRAGLRAAYLMTGPSMPMDGAPRPRTLSIHSELYAEPVPSEKSVHS